MLFKVFSPDWSGYELRDQDKLSLEIICVLLSDYWIEYHSFSWTLSERERSLCGFCQLNRLHSQLALVQSPPLWKMSYFDCDCVIVTGIIVICLNTAKFNYWQLVWLGRGLNLLLLIRTRNKHQLVPVSQILSDKPQQIHEILRCLALNIWTWVL